MDKHNNNSIVIIDTNVIVSAFLSTKQDSATVLVLELLYSQKIRIAYSEVIIKEYIDVLNRDKFQFDKAEIERFIGFIIEFGIKIKENKSNVVLNDKKDQPFYDLKCTIDNAILITGNLKHFAIEANIVTPHDFMNWYNNL